MKMQWMLAVAMAVTVGACAPTESFPKKGGDAPVGAGGSPGNPPPGGGDTSKDKPATPGAGPQIAEVTCGESKVQGILVHLDGTAKLDKDKSDHLTIYKTLPGTTNITMKVNGTAKDAAELNAAFKNAVHVVELAVESGKGTYKVESGFLPLSMPASDSEAKDGSKDKILDPSQSADLPMLLSTALKPKGDAPAPEFAVVNCGTSKVSVLDDDSVTITLDFVAVPKAPASEPPKQPEGGTPPPAPPAETSADAKPAAASSQPAVEQS